MCSVTARLIGMMRFSVGLEPLLGKVDDLIGSIAQHGRIPIWLPCVWIHIRQVTNSTGLYLPTC